MILEQLKAGIKNSREVNFLGATLKLRLLSEADILQCRLDTVAYAKDKNLDEESEATENARRQLFVAISDKDGNRIAENIDRFRELLTRNEREFLIEEYLLLEQDCIPTGPGMEQAEFNDILEQVKKNPESILNASNTATLRRLTTFLENQR